MKTVKKTTTTRLRIEIPLTIRIKDADTGVLLGEGSATLTWEGDVVIEYQYEVPEVTDYMLKGGLPGGALGALISKLISR